LIQYYIVREEKKKQEMGKLKAKVQVREDHKREQ
jgi:hypothetical protein